MHHDVGVAADIDFVTDHGHDARRAGSESVHVNDFFARMIGQARVDGVGFEQRTAGTVDVNVQSLHRFRQRGKVACESFGADLAEVFPIADGCEDQEFSGSRFVAGFTSKPVEFVHVCAGSGAGAGAAGAGAGAPACATSAAGSPGLVPPLGADAVTPLPAPAIGRSGG